MPASDPVVELPCQKAETQTFQMDQPRLQPDDSAAKLPRDTTDVASIVELHPSEYINQFQPCLAVNEKSGEHEDEQSVLDSLSVSLPRSELSWTEPKPDNMAKSSRFELAKKFIGIHKRATRPTRQTTQANPNSIQKYFGPSAGAKALSFYVDK